MSGRERKRAVRAERFKDRHSQSPAFLRVGGAAQFVQQNQRLRRHSLQHLADARDVRRETAKAFLDGLLVPHVRQHLFK